METVIDFIFLGSKITVNGDCSHKVKRLLLFGRKAMTNLDSILGEMFSAAGFCARVVHRAATVTSEVGF